MAGRVGLARMTTRGTQRPWRHGNHEQHLARASPSISTSMPSGDSATGTRNGRQHGRELHEQGTRKCAMTRQITGCEIIFVQNRHGRYRPACFGVSNIRIY